MRVCPVCEDKERTKIFHMHYKIPDNWPLPVQIDWYTCNKCGMLYGDGDISQEAYNDYYTNYYGYGINGPDTYKQIAKDAAWITDNFSPDAVILDYGGAGDDGHSLLLDTLTDAGFMRTVCAGPNDELPQECNVIYASHVLEHIYNLPEAMYKLEHALAADGTFIIDVPDSMGLLLHYDKTILDFNTKHLNHFTYRTLIYLLYRYNFELVETNQYTRDGGACVQFHFKHIRLAERSALHITGGALETINKLAQIKEPVNVWGLSDYAWYVLDKYDLDVIDYIDNDPAYRGRTYNGKEVQTQPRNDAPIVIIAQGQRGRLIANIRKAGFTNRIIEA
jgi:hypothetical protein